MRNSRWLLGAALAAIGCSGGADGSGGGEADPSNAHVTVLPASQDVPPAERSWPAVDCVGGPCGAPGVCVNLDFLFVACVPCGGNDSVCCPPYADADPSLGTCDPGLVCAPNPNFQSDPPKDLVRNVC
jgi:hypothetical protein